MEKPWQIDPELASEEQVSGGVRRKYAKVPAVPQSLLTCVPILV